MDLKADIVELAPCPVPTAAPLREVAFRPDAWLASEDDELRRLFARDDAVAAIAEALGRTHHATRTRIYALGLRRNSKRPWSELEDSELARRYGEDAAADIARDLGRAVTSVYVRAQLLGLSEPNPPRYTDWEDAQIRAGYAQGVPPGQVAALIGRTLSGVNTRASKIGARHLNQPADWSSEEMSRTLELAETGARYLAIIEQLVAEGYPRRSKAGLGPKLKALGYGRGWGRRWLPDEDELLRRVYETNASLTPLKTRLGRTTCSLRWRSKELGLQGTHANKNGFRQGPVWTAEEDDQLRSLYGTCKSKELVKTFNRNLGGIQQRAWALGLRHGFIRDFTPDEDRALGIAWLAGLGLPDLVHATSRQLAVVQKRAKRLGLMFNDPARPAKPDRARNKVRPTLEQILALEVDERLLPPRPERSRRGAPLHQERAA